MALLLHSAGRLVDVGEEFRYTVASGLAGYLGDVMPYFYGLGQWLAYLHMHACLPYG